MKQEEHREKKKGGKESRRMVAVGGRKNQKQHPARPNQGYNLGLKGRMVLGCWFAPKKTPVKEQPHKRRKLGGPRGAEYEGREGGETPSTLGFINLGGRWCCFLKLVAPTSPREGGICSLGKT